MYRVGISVYPEHCGLNETLDYIDKAGALGFKRVFTCLLSVGDKNREDLIKEFKQVCDTSHKYGMEVVLDINSKVFEKLGVSYDNLEIFKLINADGIRLDERFDGRKESSMSYNEYDLKIELNASMGSKYVDDVMSYYPNLKNLIACHNFYPQKYTGLSLEHFNECNKQMKTYSLQTAAFVSSSNKNSFGPWPVYEGLPTLEMHRDKSISLQVRHLFATRMIDDVMIGNAFALDSELEECSKIDPSILTLDIELEDTINQVEKDILYYGNMHVIRGDIGDYVFRNIQTRGIFKDKMINPNNTKDLKRGDIVVLNNNYPNYKGELQVILKDMPNDGRKNVIGKIPEVEHVLIDYIDSWRPIKFLRR